MRSIIRLSRVAVRQDPGTEYTVARKAQTQEWWLDPRTITDIFEIAPGETRVVTTTADVVVFESPEVIRERMGHTGVLARHYLHEVVLQENLDLAEAYDGRDGLLEQAWSALCALNSEAMTTPVLGPTLLRQVLRSRDPAGAGALRIDLDLAQRLVDLRVPAAGLQAPGAVPTRYCPSDRPDPVNRWRERAAAEEVAGRIHKSLAPQRPVCFGDPEEHAPHGRVCSSCRWVATCAVVVRNKARDRRDE